MRAQSFIIDHLHYCCLNGVGFFNSSACPFAGLHVCVWKKYIVIFHTITLEIVHSHPGYHIYAIISSVVITDWPCVATYQMYFVRSARRCFGSTLAPRRSIAFRNSAGTWSCAPGKQFGVLDRWRDRHTRPARWSDTLRIRPVRWRKWNRIRIDLARLADPIRVFIGPPSFSPVEDRWISRCLRLSHHASSAHVNITSRNQLWQAWHNLSYHYRRLYTARWFVMTACFVTGQNRNCDTGNVAIIAHITYFKYLESFPIFLGVISICLLILFYKLIKSISIVFANDKCAEKTK